MNGHIIGLSKRISIDEENFWNGADMLIWMEIVSVLKQKRSSVNVAFVSFLPFQLSVRLYRFCSPCT